MPVCALPNQALSRSSKDLNRSALLNGMFLPCLTRDQNSTDIILETFLIKRMGDIYSFAISPYGVIPPWAHRKSPLSGPTPGILCSRQQECGQLGHEYRDTRSLPFICQVQRQVYFACINKNAGNSVMNIMTHRSLRYA